MRFSFHRLAALVAGVAVVVSCDGAPTTTRIGSGISGGPSGTAPITPPAPGSVDSTVPIIIIDTPVVSPMQLVNVGDSILVVMRLHDERELQTVTVTGIKETGDPNLGTFVRTARYPTVTVPGTGGFRAGLTDTTIKRYLRPATPLDTTLGPLVIEAIVTDRGGNADTVRRNVEIVTGPDIAITSPANGDSVPVGVPMTISVSLTHPDGIAIDSIRVVSDASWPAGVRIDTTIVHTFPAGTRNITDTATVLIPATAPLRSRVTITATARDVNRNPGSAAPVIVFTRAVGLQAPRVFQTVPPRMEKTDSFTVTATGDGIASVGRVLRDSAGNVLRRDSVVFTAPFTSNRVVRLPLLDSLGLQGQRIDVISFAWDANTPPKIGYSMRAGTTATNETLSSAFVDTSFVTFGRTYASPRVGVMGDLLVDPTRGNVFLSNTSFNLLEVWDNTGKTFAANGVPVGAQPWGMFQSSAPDTILVGNSGATTISRVFIGTADKTAMREALNRRIRTRDLTIFRVRFARDPNTNRITMSQLPNVSYSDRPQYVVESASGRIFYSTRPTEAATPGTLRWLDPTLPFPDPQQITSYGTIDSELGSVYALFHLDSIAIVQAAPSSTSSDILFVYDHPYGQLGPVITESDSLPVDALTRLRAAGSDAFTILNLSVESLNLTDTTFVAASGNREWIGFGEGNTGGGTGRIMMVNDLPATAAPGFFSPAITVTDIVHNASEKVFGLAIDSTGLQVTSHGTQTYMAALDLPFHLRLDGVYDSFDNGAGVAYHPRAKSTLSQVDHRVSFSATSSGVIEVIDVAHYNNRGRFTTRGNLYGPLRASGPLPGDNVGLVCPGDVNCVVLKLFGLTSEGMVVIDVRASDIKPGF